MNEIETIPFSQTQSFCAYMTLENRGERCAHYRSLLNPMITKHPFILRPRPALVVIDVQRYFFDPKSPAFLPVSPALLTPIESLIRLFRHSGYPVFFTSHSDFELSPMLRWWKRGLAHESRLYQPILKAASDEIISKKYYDAFFETPLENKLRERNIEQVLLTGVMTHLCVDTTTRSAFMKGFEPAVVLDGTGSKNEFFHLNSLFNLAHGFAFMTDSKEIESCISQF